MSAEQKKLSTTLLHSIFIYTVIILVCFTCVFSLFFYYTFEKDEEHDIASTARTAALILSDKSEEETLRILQDQLETGVRYTLIDESGKVLYDSQGNAAEEENHATRPEVIEARETGSSSVTRFSNTLEQDTIYAAVLLRSGDVLRLSEQRVTFATVIKSTAPALAVALIVALLLSVALSRALTRRTVAPLNQVDISNPLNNETYEEMQPLLTRIEAQRKQLLNQNTELSRAENMRREFSANVSHELKTPLQVISGYAELLCHGNIPEEDAAKFAKIIQTEARSMTSLIDDVLALSRIEDPVLENAGKEEVELLSLTHEIIQRLAPFAEQHSVRVSCLGSTVEVNGNRSLLDQLITNLISNAVRYSDMDGEVVVSIGKNVAVPGSGTRDEAFIKVKDNGCGIPSEDLDKIFERFYRVDKSRSKENGGTGLGLAIAKHAAAFHDAVITVDSTPGQGSTFIVHIPTDK